MTEPVTQASPQPDYAKDPNKFDVQTHYWDRQGRLLKTNLYNCWNENGQKFYERPIGSGNLWHENNKPAGRRVDGKIQPGAPHIAYVPPLSEDQRVAAELASLTERNAELERELAAIHAERERAAASLSQLAKPEAGESKPKTKG